MDRAPAPPPVPIIERWQTRHDHKVCHHCAALDQMIFARGQGPKPPLHRRCRCLRVLDEALNRPLSPELAQAVIAIMRANVDRARQILSQRRAGPPARGAVPVTGPITPDGGSDAPQGHTAPHSAFAGRSPPRRVLRRRIRRG